MEIKAEKSSFSTSANFLFVLAAFVIVVAGMRAAMPIIVPFLLSVFIAIITSPFLFWLQRKKVPTVLAILIVSTVIIGGGILMVTVISTTITDFTKSLPEFQKGLQEKLEILITWLEGKGFEDSREIAKQYINLGSVMQLVSNMATQLTSLLTDGFLIFLTVIFILLEASVFPIKLKSAFGLSTKTFDQLSKVSSNIKRYLAIKTLTSLATGICVTVWLMIFGVGYPVLWGLLAFLLNFVPNIGSFIAAIPAIMLALIQYGLNTALLTALGYGIVNMFIGNLIEPRFMGRGLGLSTLVVFLSLVFWGWVLGPIGMLLSVPLTMTVKVALENHPETRWIAILLASEAPPEN